MLILGLDLNFQLPSENLGLIYCYRFCYQVDTNMSSLDLPAWM